MASPGSDYAYSHCHKGSSSVSQALQQTMGSSLVGDRLDKGPGQPLLDVGNG
jgi:hypothetical protein